MSEPNPLPRPIARALGDGADEAMVARVWRRIEARRTAPRRAPVAWAVAIAAALALAFFALPSDDGELRTSDGASLPASIDHARALELDDGSRVVIEPESTLAVLDNAADRVALQLRGRARFEIEPGGPRRWTIETALATVEVVGTVFDVDADAERVRVSVARGIVLVRGERVPERTRRLAAGESIEIVAHREAALPISAEAAEPIAVAPHATPPASEVASARSARSTRAEVAPPDDEEESSEAERAAALDASLDAADEARRAGRLDEALELLGRVSSSSDPARSAIASLTRARIELDELDRADDAATDLARALDGRLPAALEEEARARLVTAHLRAGRRADAERAAQEYAARHPRGRWTAEIERSLAP